MQFEQRRRGYVSALAAVVAAFLVIGSASDAAAKNAKPTKTPKAHKPTPTPPPATNTPEPSNTPEPTSTPTATPTPTPSVVGCGDAASTSGEDVPCSCGDTVLTNTTLDSGFDPITVGACAGEGLTLAAGVELELSTLTLAGSGMGDGLALPNGGVVRNGMVSGFGVGIRITAATAGARADVLGTTIVDNVGDGVFVDVADTESRVVIDDVTVQRNGDDGIHVRGAPGAANLEDPLDRLERSEYGFVLGSVDEVANDVSQNGGHGVHVGDPAQATDVAAFIGGTDVASNAAIGLLVESKTGSLTDCGESANWPGCTGVTIANNLIHDNAASGVELRSGVIVPLYIPGGLVPIDLGLGFVQNSVFHNAMAGAGCTVDQTAPQVLISGATALNGEVCGAAAPGSECDALSDNDGENYHCISSATECFVGWDLRGDLLEGCESGLRNAIFGYNISDASDISVGARAINNSAADASNNEWASSTSAQNVTQGAGSFIKAELTCGTRGCPVAP